MDNCVKEKRSQQRKEYYRKWRAEHQDSIRASQMRYWTKKAEEMRATTMSASEQEEKRNGQLLHNI